MHVQALEAVRRMVNTSGYINDPFFAKPGVYREGLDLGGADINGTARTIVPYIGLWEGLDLEPGPGVDHVADARFWKPPHQFDVVLCTELLEHVNGAASVLETIWAALGPGGYLFLTCAGADGTTGRRPHGARGELDPPPGEHYQNIHIQTLRRALGRFPWASVDATYARDPGDIYLWARKAS